MKIINIFFITIIFWSFNSLAEISQSANFMDIEALMQKADRETLVIFDIQDVLLEPYDQILKVQNKKQFDIFKNEFINNKFSKTKAKELRSIIWLQRSNGPVDIRFVNLIENLQNKNIKVIALTNCATGELGQIKSVEKWRLDELNKSGYNFGKSWPDLKHNSQLLENNKNLSYMDGVIFTSRNSKSESLAAFLEYSKFKPQKIIFIDDKKMHIQNLEKFAMQSNIEFYGLEYSAAREAILLPYNEQLAKFQFQYLIKHHKWLSDEQAQAMFKYNHF